MVEVFAIFNDQLYPVVGLLGKSISNVRPTDRTIFRSLSTAQNGRAITSVPSFVKVEQDVKTTIQNNAESNFMLSGYQFEPHSSPGTWLPCGSSFALPSFTRISVVVICSNRSAD